MFRCSVVVDGRRNQKEIVCVCVCVCVCLFSVEFFVYINMFLIHKRMWFVGISCCVSWLCVFVCICFRATLCLCLVYLLVARRTYVCAVDMWNREAERRREKKNIYSRRRRRTPNVCLCMYDSAVMSGRMLYASILLYISFVTSMYHGIRFTSDFSFFRFIKSTTDAFAISSLAGAEGNTIALVSTQ